MSAANHRSTRTVPAARRFNQAHVQEALGVVFNARGLIAGASLLAGLPRVSTRDASLRAQSAQLADEALTACIDATHALDTPAPDLARAASCVAAAQGHVTAASAILDATEARNTSDACLQALDLYGMAAERLDRAATAITLAGEREAA